MTKPVFILVKNTPKTTRIYASDGVSPPGSRIHLLPESHPHFLRAAGVVRLIDEHLIEKYPGRRVSLEAIARHVVVPGVDLVYLKGNPTTPDRILLKFETLH